MMILADAGYTVAHYAIMAMVIAGIIGIVYVVARQCGITIPPFIITILWICLAVAIGVLAVKFLLSI